MPLDTLLSDREALNTQFALTINPFFTLLSPYTIPLYLDTLVTFSTVYFTQTLSSDSFKAYFLEYMFKHVGVVVLLSENSDYLLLPLF